MGAHRPPPTGGERWSNTYRNPTFDLDTDQVDNSMLVSDIRRATRVALIVIIGLAIALAISGSIQAGLNLMMIAGGPIVIIAITGQLVRLYVRRRSSHDL